MCYLRCVLVFAVYSQLFELLQLLVILQNLLELKFQLGYLFILLDDLRLAFLKFGLDSHFLNLCLS